jgi:uncharacterized membrane protein (DUF485 family)
MAKISHTKIKQPSFGEKRQKFPVWTATFSQVMLAMYFYLGEE